MPRHLHLIATCTDRKRGDIPAELRLREIASGAPEQRAKAWWARLDRFNPLLRVEAARVYLGEHWNIVQDLTSSLRASGWRVDLWVASAGYGLLGEKTAIVPYSATFSENSPDRVALDVPSPQRAAYLQAWWSALADLRARDTTHPASLAALAATHPHATMLLLASPDYVRAMALDLKSALQHLVSTDQLAVITSGTRWTDGPLSDQIVAIDDRTRSAWGGTMQGLHARAARELLLHAGPPPPEAFTAEHLRVQYLRMVGETPRPERLNRTKMSDEEVIEFLRAEFRKQPGAGWTLLLRTLRGSGRACEQRRFRELHAKIAEEAVRLSGDASE